MIISSSLLLFSTGALHRCQSKSLVIFYRYSSSMSIQVWLDSLSLSQYLSQFITHGYDTLERCAALTSADLDIIGVTRPGHKKRILSSIINTHEEPLNADHRDEPHQFAASRIISIQDESLSTGVNVDLSIRDELRLSAAVSTPSQNGSGVNTQ